MFASPPFWFKLEAAAVAFVADLGEPDPGEAYVVEANGAGGFNVAVYAGDVRLFWI